METALQQAIEEIKSKSQIDKAEALAILYAYLPTEKEQLSKFFEKGSENMFDSGNFEQYYTETFKTDKDENK